jgi:hypothetical protein
MHVYYTDRVLLLEIGCSSSEIIVYDNYLISQGLEHPVVTCRILDHAQGVLTSGSADFPGVSPEELKQRGTARFFENTAFY